MTFIIISEYNSQGNYVPLFWIHLSDVVWKYWPTQVIDMQQDKIEKEKQ